MTLKELYFEIDGDYDQAINVLRIEKLIDKHIRKFPTGGVVANVIEAGKSMDPTGLFESAHAMKGVCSNLGLTKLAASASKITEEYRPGNARKLTDGEIKAVLAEIETLYAKTVKGIEKYVESAL